ncbi:MAG: hypothetical protein DME05_18480 [Candidatus Rokuibacteriota bacterium]|nr:MAG: hypothetical protein DME05_18480 [Candidatus Rokubacteria bacterium]PYN73999.1 MAG: hypothetical protein DMD97_18960 [Candidatus Rokubacteria bacterium]
MRRPPPRGGRAPGRMARRIRCRPVRGCCWTASRAPRRCSSFSRARPRRSPAPPSGFRRRRSRPARASRRPTPRSSRG